jgi:gallate dioxygenase
VPTPPNPDPDTYVIRSRLIDYSKPLAGTYLSTGLRAQRGYRLSKFCRAFMDPAKRDAFKADPEKYMAEFGLTETERNFIRQQDWNGMLRYGVSTFLLQKLAAALGVAQNRMGAAMRGESFEDFLKTRKVPGAL